MAVTLKTLALLAVTITFSASAFAQSTKEVRSPAPFVLPVSHEPAPKLILESPLPEQLARGAILIPFRVENFRILPVVGADALKLSPRVGHLHVTVDDLPWHWAEFSASNTIAVVGMPPGQHKVLIELADPTHHVLTGQTVTFTVPSPAK